MRAIAAVTAQLMSFATLYRDDFAAAKAGVAPRISRARRSGIVSVEGSTNALFEMILRRAWDQA
jgi:hypothetical protein